MMLSIHVWIATVIARLVMVDFLKTVVAATLQILHSSFTKCAGLSVLVAFMPTLTQSNVRFALLNSNVLHVNMMPLLIIPSVLRANTELIIKV